MVDNSGGQPDRGVVNVTVVVKDQNGAPLANETVELEDRGGMCLVITNTCRYSALV